MAGAAPGGVSTNQGVAKKTVTPKPVPPVLTSTTIQPTPTPPPAAPAPAPVSQGTPSGAITPTPVAGGIQPVIGGVPAPAGATTGQGMPPAALGGGITPAPAGSIQPITVANVPGYQPTGGVSAGQGTPIHQPGQPQMPAPRPMPSVPSGPPNPYMTDFGPGNDLRFQQINPQGDPRLGRTQGAVDAATQALSGGPDRTALANDLFSNFISQSDPGFQQNLREITQRQAAGGRLGSGMYGSNLVDATTQRQNQITGYGKQLAYDTANGTINDQFNRVNTLAGLEGQQYGQNAGQRNELRGERTYQSGVAQQAQNDAIQQRLLEDQLLGNQFGRDLSLYQTQGQFGFGANPAGTLGGLAGDTQNAANNAGNGAADLFTQWLLSQRAGG